MQSDENIGIARADQPITRRISLAKRSAAGKAQMFNKFGKRKAYRGNDGINPGVLRFNHGIARGIDDIPVVPVTALHDVVARTTIERVSAAAAR